MALIECALRTPRSVGRLTAPLGFLEYAKRKSGLLTREPPKSDSRPIERQCVTGLDIRRRKRGEGLVATRTYP